MRCCSCLVVCFPKLVETSIKRNFIKWYGRCVSFWSDCDELIQEWLNNVLEAEDSEGSSLVR